MLGNWLEKKGGYMINLIKFQGCWYPAINRFFTYLTCRPRIWQARVVKTGNLLLVAKNITIELLKTLMNSSPKCQETRYLDLPHHGDNLGSYSAKPMWSFLLELQDSSLEPHRYNFLHYLWRLWYGIKDWESMYGSAVKASAYWIQDDELDDKLSWVQLPARLALTPAVIYLKKPSSIEPLPVDTCYARCPLCPLRLIFVNRIRDTS